MSKQSFEAILEKYLLGKCSASEKLLVEQWYDLIGDEAKIPTSDQEWETIKSRMWLEISKDSNTTMFSFWKSPLYVATLAAAILITLSLSMWYFSKPEMNLKNGYFVKHENNTEKPKLIKLSDGSTVTLEPNSILSLSKKFNITNREVELIGKAKFEIKKDINNPFLVHANTLVTKVVGTVFTIDANAKAVQVAVISGKVSVYKQQDYSADLKHKHQGMVINPNQQLNFTVENEKFDKTISDAPNLLANSIKINFNYIDTSSAQVFENIKDAYGVIIIYDEAILKNCPVTADITDETLYEKLFIVCKAIEANYETIDGQIIISSNGCK